jgi:hypothetical protein
LSIFLEDVQALLAIFLSFPQGNLRFACGGTLYT